MHLKDILPHLSADLNGGFFSGITSRNAGAGQTSGECVSLLLVY